MSGSDIECCIAHISFNLGLDVLNRLKCDTNKLTLIKCAIVAKKMHKTAMTCPCLQPIYVIVVGYEGRHEGLSRLAAVGAAPPYPILLAFLSWSLKRLNVS